MQTLHDTGTSMWCAVGSLCPFLSRKKTSWFFIVAVGRPHLCSTRRSFSLYNSFTLPGRAGGCLCAKANNSKCSRHPTNPAGAFEDRAITRKAGRCPAQRRNYSLTLPRLTRLTGRTMLRSSGSSPFKTVRRSSTAIFAFRSTSCRMVVSCGVTMDA